MQAISSNSLSSSAPNHRPMNGTTNGSKSATALAAQKSRANRASRAHHQLGAKAASTHNGHAVARTNSGGYQQERSENSGIKVKKGYDKAYGSGKFSWGAPGDEYIDCKIDSRDPNYDSMDDDDGNPDTAILSILEHHARIARKAGISTRSLHGSGHLTNKATTSVVPSVTQLPPKMPLAEFKQKCLNIVDEYLVSEDVDELCDDLHDLKSPMLHYEFVRRAITLAMERKDHERELISEALAELYGRRILTSESIGKGFERLFELATDLELDIPQAKKYLAQFLARAVVDELLPPAFLAEPLFEHLGGEIVNQAKVLLSMKHGMARLEHIWGPTIHSVDELKHEIKMLLEEFLSSSDIDEACSCVKRLNVPHFHHEIVKRAVVLSLDCHEREQAMMSSLLAELHSREITSSKQIQIGFGRLYDEIADLELDAPGATRILNVFLSQAVKDGCIGAESAAKIASR